VIALTHHICAHCSSVIVTEHKRFTSWDFVVLRRSFISSIAIARIDLNLPTASDPLGLNEYPTAFCQKLSSGLGSVDGSDSGTSLGSIEMKIKK